MTINQNRIQDIIALNKGIAGAINEFNRVDDLELFQIMPYDTDCSSKELYNKAEKAKMKYAKRLEKYVNHLHIVAQRHRKNLTKK